MVDSSIVQVLIFIAIPYVLKAIGSLVNKKPANEQGPSRPPRPPSQWTKVMTIVLALVALYHLAALFIWTPPNAFQAVGLPLDTPNYILRQAWQERSNSAVPAIVRASLDPNDSRLQLNSFSRLYSEDLRERFKSAENRLLYGVFGHDTFVKCDYCTERSDYLYFLLPNLLTSYVCMATVLGLATVQPPLNTYRTYGVVGLTTVALIEYHVVSTGSDVQQLGEFIVQQKSLGVTTARAYRHWLFFFYALILLVMSIRFRQVGGPITEGERIQELCQAQEVIIQRQRALQLARGASFRDPQLRKQFVEFWKRREVEHGLLTSDVEYKSARDLALGRIDVESTMKEADQYIESIVKAGSRGETMQEVDASISENDT